MDEQKPDRADRPEPAGQNAEVNFDSVYANNSLFESSVWDLKILFGQLEQHTGREKIDWHTAVTIPWMHAKILCYFLRLNLAFFEAQFGRIVVPPIVTPPMPPPLPEESADNPVAKQMREIAVNLRAEMFGQG